MNVDGVLFRTIWPADDMVSAGIIDQRTLPFAFTTRAPRSVDDCASAASESQVHIEWAVAELTGTRPAAVNLAGVGGGTATRNLTTRSGRRHREAIRRRGRRRLPTYRRPRRRDPVRDLQAAPRRRRQRVGPLHAGWMAFVDHLMQQHGLVEFEMTGRDRTSRQGDLANRIGTYGMTVEAYERKNLLRVVQPASSLGGEA